MKPFRKHVVLSVDGGSLYGVIPAHALMKLEEHLQEKNPGSDLLLKDVFCIAAGTSTGSIITASIFAGLEMKEVLGLYRKIGPKIFKSTLRSTIPFRFLFNYSYHSEPLKKQLEKYLRHKTEARLLTMGDLWTEDYKRDLVITLRDMLAPKTCFLKPYKPEYQSWTLVDAVLASTCIPTAFPLFKNRYADGGVGSYSNPCFMAAFEAIFCWGLHPDEVTLISLGTGIEKNKFKEDKVKCYNSLTWVPIVLQQFLDGVNRQQSNSVNTIYRKPEEYIDSWRDLPKGGLDFRRFNVAFDEADMSSEDPKFIEILIDKYGNALWEKMKYNILDDEGYDIEKPKDLPIPVPINSDC